MKGYWLYLWYSLVLVFPPLHELGHCMISWMIGERITDLYWDHVFFGNVNPGLHFVHGLWEYSVLVPGFCALLFLGLVLKDIRVNKKIRSDVVC